MRIKFSDLLLLLTNQIMILQKAHSVAKIEHPEVMGEATHKLKQGGLNDPRIGTTDPNFNVRHAEKGWQSVLVILVTSSWRGLCSIQVSHPL